MRTGLAFVLLLVACDSEPEMPLAADAWTLQTDPVWTGDGIASDPSVVRDGDGYRMCYTCLDAATGRTAICGATSDDGLAWAHAPAEGTPRGVLVRGFAGTPEASVEGCELVRRGDAWLLYYSGYPEVGSPVPGFPATLFLATSSDGLAFERQGLALERSPGTRDADAVYSPTILDRGGLLSMVYTGHCYTDCPRGAGVSLLAATSTDGRTWTKAADPVLLADPDLAWTRDGVGEAALFEDAAGLGLLVTGGLGDDETHRVGLARAPTLDGPWRLAATPVLTAPPDGFAADGVLAPSVLVEDSRTQAWVTGLSARGGFAVGLAEAP